MQQQINLLSLLKQGKQDKYQLSVNHFYIINLIINLFFIINIAISLAQFTALNHDVKERSLEVFTQERKIAAVKKKFPKAFFTKKNESETIMKDNISAARKLLEIFNPPIYLSDVLFTISQAITEEVWIVKVNASDNISSITISGNSYSLPKLQQFIDNISRDTKFANYIVDVGKLSQKEEKNKPNLIDFEIRLTEKTS